MNCGKIEKSLIAYLDRKASLSERRRVEAHLAKCADCRERANQFRLVWDTLDELPIVVPSPGFDARVRARVAEGPSGIWAWLVPSYRMAFATAVLVLFSVWMSSFQSPRIQVAEAAPAQGTEAEFEMINNLPVLEDYDVLANFDALSELPAKNSLAPQAQQPTVRQEM